MTPRPRTTYVRMILCSGQLLTYKQEQKVKIKKLQFFCTRLQQKEWNQKNFINAVKFTLHIKKNKKISGENWFKLPSTPIGWGPSTKSDRGTNMSSSSCCHHKKKER